MKSRLQLYLVVAGLALVFTAALPAQTTRNPAADDTTPVRGALAVRGVTAVAGWIPSAYLGALIASAFPHGQCHCDDPGLTQALTGAVIGGAFGAALGAAAPELRSRCSFGKRFGRSLLGSALGTALGMVPFTEGSQALTVPLFSVVGAALAEGRC